MRARHRFFLRGFCLDYCFTHPARTTQHARLVCISPPFNPTRVAKGLLYRANTIESAVDSLAFSAARSWPIISPRASDLAASDFYTSGKSIYISVLGVLSAGSFFCASLDDDDDAGGAARINRFRNPSVKVRTYRAREKKGRRERDASDIMRSARFWPI